MKRNDDFLHRFRKAPRPEFGRALYQRLTASETAGIVPRSSDGRNLPKKDKQMEGRDMYLTLAPTEARRPVRLLQGQLVWAMAAVLTVVFCAALIIHNAPDVAPWSGGFRTEQEDNLNAFQRYVDEAWNAGNLLMLTELLASDYVRHEPGMGDIEGIQAMSDFITAFRSAFEDMQLEIEDVGADGDDVWARVSFTGTHIGLLALPDGTVIPPSGQPVTVAALYMATFSDGKMTELWVQSDWLGMIQQLGIVSSVQEMVTEAQNLDVAGRVIDELWGGTNLDSAKELYNSPSYFFAAHSDLKAVRTPTQWREMYENLHRAIPDLQVTVEQRYAEGDMVVVHYAAEGTLEESYLTTTAKLMPGTGETIKWDGVFVYRLEDHRIVDEWWFWDNKVTGEIDYCK